MGVMSYAKWIYENYKTNKSIESDSHKYDQISKYQREMMNYFKNYVNMLFQWNWWK